MSFAVIKVQKESSTLYLESVKFQVDQAEGRRYSPRQNKLHRDAVG